MWNQYLAFGLVAVMSEPLEHMELCADLCDTCTWILLGIIFLYVNNYNSGKGVKFLDYILHVYCGKDLS
jgi:hypothetical protein